MGHNNLEPHNEGNLQVNKISSGSLNNHMVNVCFSNRNAEEQPKSHREKLRARVKALRETMTTLKEELLEEKALWRKEIEEIANLMNDPTDPDLSDIDYNLKPVPNVQMNATDLILTSPIIRDYEEKITRYQGALAQAQAEKRYNIRRQIAANTYRKRLNEVEKLCQEELAKVRETATYLEPLKQMASEWNKGKSLGKEGHTDVQRRRQNVECGGDSIAVRGNGTPGEEDSFEVPVKQIDASLVVDEDASSEIKGKIVLQIGSLPSEVPTICYSAKFE